MFSIVVRARKTYECFPLLLEWEKLMNVFHCSKSEKNLWMFSIVVRARKNYECFKCQRKERLFWKTTKNVAFFKLSCFLFLIMAFYMLKMKFKKRYAKIKTDFFKLLILLLQVICFNLLLHMLPLGLPHPCYHFQSIVAYYRKATFNFK